MIIALYVRTFGICRQQFQTDAEKYIEYTCKLIRYTNYFIKMQNVKPTKFTEKKQRNLQKIIIPITLTK